MHGYAKILGALIRAGAELEVVGRKRKTALHIAALHGRYDCVAALLAAGADVDARDKHGHTPLAKAIFKGRPRRRLQVRRVFPLLLRAGANSYSPRILHNGAYYSYVRRVNGAGGFHAYEKEHLAALVATFAPKLDHLLPEELVGVVMMFYAHVGFY